MAFAQPPKHFAANRPVMTSGPLVSQVRKGAIIVGNEAPIAFMTACQE